MMLRPNEIEYDHNGAPSRNTGMDYGALVDLVRKNSIREGIEIGKAEIIKTMKAERVDYMLIAKYTGMSMDGIERA